MHDPLQYEGKRVLVTGAASGMGAATASILTDLGAEVHGLDIAEGTVPVAAFHRCDLRDPEAIDRTVASVGAPVNSLFNCAGLPTTAPGHLAMAVNFIGHRHLTEAVVALMAEGSSVGFISSVGGMGWIDDLELLGDLLGTPDVASATEWCAGRDIVELNGYGFSKEAINAYVAMRGCELAARGIRLNSINPGPTDTPMMPAFIESMGADFMANLPRPMGRNSTPEEQAWPLVMLNSPRQSYTAATTLFTDGAFAGGLHTGQLDFGALG